MNILGQLHSSLAKLVAVKALLIIMDTDPMGLKAKVLEAILQCKSCIP